MPRTSLSHQLAETVESYAVRVRRPPDPHHLLDDLLPRRETDASDIDRIVPAIAEQRVLSIGHNHRAPVPEGAHLVRPCRRCIFVQTRAKTRLFGFTIDDGVEVPQFDRVARQ